MSDLHAHDYKVLAEFRYHLRRFLRFSERAAAAVGVPAQQHQALLAIKGFGLDAPISIGDLAEYLQIRHHTAVELVNRLEGQSFVRRDVGEDRRAVALSLTEQGEQVLAQLALIHRDEIQRMLPMLNAVLHQLTQETTPQRSEA